MDSLRNMLGKSMMLIDAGNVHSLKKGGRYDREAGFIIDVMNRQDYDLSVLGPKDFVLADSSLRPMLKQSKFKWIGSNFPSKDRPRGVRDYVIQKVDGVKVGVFSYVDPGYRQNNMDSSRVTDNLVETARYLREKCDVVVLVAHTNNREPEPLAQRVPEVDLLVLGGVTNPWRTMKQDSTVYIGNSGDRGRHIARFELLLNREKSIVESKYELVKLKHEVPRDPEVVRQMEDFAANEERIRREELETMRLAKLAELGIDPRDTAGQDSPYSYVGEKECRTCHLDYYNSYRRTSHARAFSDLIRARKSHDEDLIPRHVTGYLEKSGFINKKETSNLYNVQCEACHGRASEHVAQKGEALETLIQDPAQTCAKCHGPEHDPDFDLAEALKSVHDVSSVIKADRKIISRDKNSPVQPGKAPPGLSNKASTKATKGGGK